MSRISNLFAAGVFIVFLAVLFHYFCRVRRKPEMIVQQQIQVPEGYVYPISANTNNAHHHLIIAQNYGHLHPSLMNNVPNMPYPVNTAAPYPYNLANNTMHLYGQGFGPTSQHFSNPAHPNPPADDLPPPYDVAVTRAIHPQS